MVVSTFDMSLISGLLTLHAFTAHDETSRGFLLCICMLEITKHWSQMSGNKVKLFVMWCVQVDGVSVTGMSQPQVVQLLRMAQEKVTLLVSRQETIDAQEDEEVRA